MTVEIALVRMRIPSIDPLVDGMSVELVYQEDGATPDALVAHCPGLFNTAGAGATQPLYKYLSPVLDRGENHCTIDVYDITGHLDGTAHGSPVASGTWTLNTFAGPAAVEGISCCVNYRSDYGTDVEFGVHTRPRSRDRNRHYFGPLTTDTLLAPTTGARVTFAPQFITDVLHNTKQVEVIAVGAPADQWNLQVWSRVGAFVKPVAEYWTDDRPDYQRRRSDAPGVKTFLAA